jgi:hypothetical protein
MAREKEVGQDALQRKRVQSVSRNGWAAFTYPLVFGRLWLLGAGTDRKAGFSDYEPTAEQGEKRRRCMVYRTLVETIR